MFLYFKMTTALFVALFSFNFAQDVTLTLEGNNLNYSTNQPIAGFQFNHDGCVTGASGGDSGAAGFMISVTKSRSCH